MTSHSWHDDRTPELHFRGQLATQLCELPYAALVGLRTGQSQSSEADVAYWKDPFSDPFELRKYLPI